MPSGTPETFTGSNGSAPNATNVAVSFVQGAGAISVQGNEMRMRTGTTSGQRISVRLTGVSVADAELVFTHTLVNTSYPYVVLRGASNLDTGNGYHFTLEPADMTLSRHVAYAGPDLATITHGFTLGQRVRTRVAIFGQVIRARTWLATDPEPTSTWQITYTDPSGSGGITAAGMIGWTTSSASGGAKDFFVDDVDAKDTLTPTLATLLATASISPSAALIKTMPKVFTAGISPAGALIQMRVVVRVFTAGISPAGAFIKALPRTFTASITPSAALIKKDIKVFASLIIPVATLKKGPARKFTGSVSPAGAAVMTFVGRIFGRPGIVVMSLVTRAEVRIRHRKG
jgi:hypothetical protein